MIARHVFRQGPVLGAFAKTAARAMRARPGSAPATPGPALERTVGPRSRAMIDDYLRWAGGNPASWKGAVPPHLFSQWGFPLLADVLATVPYDLTKVVNAGCRIEIAGRLPDDEPLHLRAWLEGIDDDGRRALLEQRLVTGTASSPQAVTATLFAHVPLGKREKGGAKKEKPRVPDTARPIGRRRLGANAGVQFGALTGDFNPVHWLAPYARAAGFRGTILQGFGTLAIACEALTGAVLAGDPSRLRSVEARFTRPLVLPGEVGVFVDDAGGLFAGEAPGGPAFLVGGYTHV